MATVAFLGVGNMGAPMASNIARKSNGVVSSLIVYDVFPDSARKCASDLADAGIPVHFADTLDKIASFDPDVVITMVPASADVVQAVVGTRELAKGKDSEVKPGSLLNAILERRRANGNTSQKKRMILLDMTSGEPGLTFELSELLAGHGIGTVDAPVSGGVPRAKPGTLAIMIGGSQQDITTVEPILKLMGTSLTVCGERVGSGQCMKALNNYVSTAGFLAAIEALAAGKKFGLDTSLMVDVMNSGTAMNNSTKNKMHQFVLNHGYNAGFGLDLLVKDLGIARGIMDTGVASSSSANDDAYPLATTVIDMVNASRDIVGKGKDHTEMGRITEKKTGVEL